MSINNIATQFAITPQCRSQCTPLTGDHNELKNGRLISDSGQWSLYIMYALYINVGTATVYINELQKKLLRY